MRKKIIILVFILSLFVAFGLSASTEVDASYTDVEFEETSVPSK